MGIATPRLEEREHNGDDGPAQRGHGRRRHHDFASTEAFNGEVGSTCEEQVVHAAASCKESGIETVELEGVDENVRHVVSARLLCQ